MWKHRIVMTGAGVTTILIAGMVSAPVSAGVAHAPTVNVAKLPHAASPSISQAMPAAYDPVAQYEAQSQCDPKPKPGTAKLAALIKRTYGQRQSIGISRSCGVGGTSEHKEGRALDWMTSVRSPRGRANAEAFLGWLLGPDQSGVAHGNATRLGVMYIGWNNKFWAAYSADSGWTELKGCFAKPGAGNDTTCHRNHVHISLNWDGASGRTSMWDGTVLSAYCSSGRTSAVVLDLGRSVDATPITPFRALSTRAGLGIAAPVDMGGWGDGNFGGDYRDGDVPDPSIEPSPEPTPEPTPLPTPAPTPIPVSAACRVHSSGWHDGLGGILTKVTGQGGVPETGVAAVAVTVMAQGSTAPAHISVWAPGETMGQQIVTVKMNGHGSGTAVVPVASDGTIALGTSLGAADLVVDVTAYFVPGDQPNVTTATSAS